MVGSPWFTAALGAMSVLLFPEGTLAMARGEFRHAASPSYRKVDICPERCRISGPNAGNWSVYANFKPITKCPESLFYEFSIYDEVDNPDTNHRIHACSSFGSDFSTLPAPKSEPIVAQSVVDVDFEIGWWDEGFGLAASGLRSLILQMRQYADGGYGATDSPLIMFGQFGKATIGLYIGQGLQNQGLSASALKLFQNKLSDPDLSTPSLAMQLCGPGFGSDHIFGLMVTSNGTFTPIQDAMKAWANGTCLSFEASTHVTGQAHFTTPLLHSNVTTNSTLSHKRHFEHHARHNALHSRSDEIQARAECRTEVVAAGQGCAEMAAKCKITAADFTKYNSATNFCATLMPNQHVCCSSGTMPDFRPKPNGTYCYAYTVKAGDNCDNLAAAHGLKRQDIEDFNKKTWGWNGCQLLFTETKICLSTGTPPFPATIANAVCGPMKPGTTRPTDGSDFAKLNPCPINACCNIWGQCGVNKDFCVDTNTGAPGTAKAGTYGCISNCGTDIVNRDGRGAINIGYFQGYGLDRPCLYQDASQIDTAKYTHIHFGFGTLTPNYEVRTGDVLSTYQFEQFKKITGSLRILSFGGWNFSTDPSTYSIFRNGVTAANRFKMATNIANFIKTHDLDGVDIDWEYPGAPDMPNIPAGGKDEGDNYLAFLVILKNMLPGKSVAICAPASYWYLRQYPLLALGKVVDYIVFMTYDLHGQWDAQNMNSIEDCDTGSCLRSQVNLTETKQALSMITKAGVPGRKVIVGVTSYGRSFRMAQPGCWGPTCKFTGTRDHSEATPGICTGQGGYIADAEINEIIQGNTKKRAGRVVTSFLDTSSNSDILVYDTDQYVSYMSPTTKKIREVLYKNLGLGGTTDWAVDLQEYHDPPIKGTTWDGFKLLARSGKDPKNWKSLDCNSTYIRDHKDHYPAEKWEGLMADAAWQEILKDWETNSKRADYTFMDSVEGTLHAGAMLRCQDMLSSNCEEAKECSPGMNGADSGPAGYLILNSLVQIHQMHKAYWDTLISFSSTASFGLDDFEKTFAPIPPEKGTPKWLLLLIDLLTMGASAIAGPFFNSGIKGLASFADKTGVKAVNTKEFSMMMIGQSTTLAKDMMPAIPPDKWTADGQDFYTQYMGSIVDIWKRVAEENLADIMGSPDTLGKLMANGQLIHGKFDGDIAKHNKTTQMESNFKKAFYGVTIPGIWRASGNSAFIMDSGDECGKHTKTFYLSDETKEATGACVDGKQYYLVQAKGPASTCTYQNHADCDSEKTKDNKFSTLPGLESTEKFGVTLQELIEGSVRTYIANDNKNGGGFKDTSNEAFLDRLDLDVTVPGFITLPVCSPGRAFNTWYDSKSQASPQFPCDNPMGYAHCDAASKSTFVNKASEGSPLVQDCQEIIKRLEADFNREWKVSTVGHHELESHESCHFGFQSNDKNTNYEFYVGGQDVIRLMQEAIKQHEWMGKVSVEGETHCNGRWTNNHGAKWGIY